jgi:hypothetical protein
MTPDPAELANLRDLALPPPVAWWPPAPGWWVLGAGLLTCVLLLILRAVLRYLANAYRREAARALRDPAAAPAIAAVLKRAALASYPRADVAGLTGTAWSAFLGRTGGFPDGAAAALHRASLDPSRPLDAAEAPVVLASARSWVRRHRRPSA